MSYNKKVDKRNALTLRQNGDTITDAEYDYDDDGQAYGAAFHSADASLDYSFDGLNRLQETNLSSNIEDASLSLTRSAYRSMIMKRFVICTLIGMLCLALYACTRESDVASLSTFKTTQEITTESSVHVALPESTTKAEYIIQPYSVHEKFFSIDVEQNEYVATIFDVNGNILFKESFGWRTPVIKMIDSEILEFSLSAGTDAQWTRFYNVTSGRESPIYVSVRLVYDGKVIYIGRVDGRSALIVRDIFDEGLYYKEIIFDFSPFTSLSSALTDVKVIADNVLQITYLAGGNYEEKTQEVLL